MELGLALLTLLGIGLVVSIFDDDDNTVAVGGDEVPAGQEGEGDPPAGQQGDDPIVIAGTEDADTLQGGDPNEFITGGGGDDDLSGGLGDDTIEGGTGDDIIQGQGGFDVLIGNEGSDLIQGRGGDDTVQGFFGDDWVDGNDGNDFVRGGAGDDVVIGGAGEDAVFGRNGDDLVIGGALPGTPLTDAQLDALRDGDEDAAAFLDDAILVDDQSADSVDGGDGDDVLVFGAGDTANGGAGDDIFTIFGDGSDVSEGGSVVEDFNAADDSLVVYFSSIEAAAAADITVTDEGDDAVVRINGEIYSTVVGAAGELSASDIAISQPAPDTDEPIIGTAEGEAIDAGDGNDVVNAGGGDDDVLGGFGDDTLNGEAGADVIQGQGGFDVINGGEDDDLMQGRGGNDVVSGGLGNDWVDGNDGDDVVDGGVEDDTVVGGLGADEINGGEGADVLVGGELLADPLTTKELGNIRSGQMLDEAIRIDIGESIQLVDDGFADTLDGGNGSDILFFGAGDTATGGGGADDFGIIAMSGAGAPAIIADFDSAEDEVFIIDPAFDPAGVAPVVTVIDDGADAQILLDGEVIGLVVAGAGKVSASDISVQGATDTSVFEPNPGVPVAIL